MKSYIFNFQKGFQDDESIDAITEFLSEYGRVDGVQLQRTKDKKFKVVIKLVI